MNFAPLSGAAPSKKLGLPGNW